MHKKRWFELFKIDRVESLIRENGLKKGAFCAMLGRGRTWIDDWKRGRSLPDENTVSQIAEVLHTTPAYLMGETDDPGEKKEPTGENASGLSDEDRELIEAFRVASPEKRQAILALLK